MSDFLLYQYVDLDPEVAPLSQGVNPRHLLNLNQLGLEKHKEYRYGLKISTIWYAQYDEQKNRYDTPLARVIRQTMFDDNGIPTKITKSLSLKYQSSGWSDPYVWTERVDKPKKFLKVMRSRAVDELEDLAAKFGLAAKILELYDKHQSEILLYQNSGSTAFRDAVAADTSKWLDEVNQITGNKPRDIIVQYASIGVMQK